MPQPGSEPEPGRETASGGSRGFVVNGDGVTLVQAEHIGAVHLPPKPVHSFDDGPLRLGPIPGLAASRREREVDHRLYDGFDEDTRCQILTGTSGVGKTQLAASYARDLLDRGEIDLVVWVGAASAGSVVDGFAAASGAVGAADAEGGLESAQRFLSWLGRPDAPRWLVVLDDLVDPNNLNNDQLWPPACARGRTVVTTWNRDAALDGPHRRRLPVEVFTSAEASSYLTERIGDPCRTDEVAELAEDLGRLPLALAHAAAYILDDPTLTCNQYRTLLADETVRLTELSPDVFPDGYPRSVAAAWTLAIRRADRFEPFGLVSALLAMTCLLDSAGIPRKLFTCEYGRDFLKAVIPDSIWDAADEAAATRTIQRSLGRMHRLCLADVDPESVRIHGLLQRSTRDRLPSVLLDALAPGVADALEQIWPDPDLNPVASAPLRANAFRLRELRGAALVAPHPNDVLFSLGDSVGFSGRVVEAREYFQRLAAECAEALGASHQSVLRAKGAAAKWLGEQSGRDSEAADELRAVLDEQERTPGVPAGAIRHTRQQLARWLGRAGRRGEGAAEYAKLERDFEDLQGNKRISALVARGNLIRFRPDHWSAERALLEIRRLREDFEALPDQDDPYVRQNTHAVRSTIVNLLMELERYDEALADIDSLMADLIDSVGPESTTVLEHRHNRALLLSKAGHTEDAIEEFEALLEICHRSLSPGHSLFDSIYASLAKARLLAGDEHGSLRAQEWLLERVEQQNDPDHPVSREARSRLKRLRARLDHLSGQSSSQDRPGA